MLETPCARCRHPPAACTWGPRGLGRRSLLSEGDLQSCPGLWKGSGAPAGGQEAAGLGPASLFRQGSFPEERGAGRGVVRALGLSDSFRDTAFVPLLSPTDPRSRPRLWPFPDFSSLARSLGLSCPPPHAPTRETSTRCPLCWGPSKGDTGLQVAIRQPNLTSCVHLLTPFPAEKPSNRPVDGGRNTRVSSWSQPGPRPLEKQGTNTRTRRHWRAPRACAASPPPRNHGFHSPHTSPSPHRRTTLPLGLSRPLLAHRRIHVATESLQCAPSPGGMERLLRAGAGLLTVPRSLGCTPTPRTSASTRWPPWVPRPGSLLPQGLPHACFWQGR